MKTYTKEELKTILENHQHWLREDCYGWENMRADLSRAYLSGAYLSGAKDIPFVPYSCPDFGMFVGFKKASGKIVALEIPEDAKRCSATGRKCRCDKAKVLGIYDYEHNLLTDTEVVSNYDNKTTYKVGEMVYPDSYDENRWNECSHGIHFFINFQEAVNYNA